MDIKVFDPPMCCSTGICGPSVDPELVRFAADLDWLKGQGVQVERANLSQQPFDFTGDPAVNAALQAKGVEVLPIVKVAGEIRSEGRYPAREELAGWAGLSAPAPSLFTDAVAELVALGASIASNCESCFRAHYDRARKLGVSKEDMMLAVRMAESVRSTPAKAVLGLAERYLEGKRPRGSVRLVRPTLLRGRDQDPAREAD